MYPNPNCPHCQAAQPPIHVEEDTRHMLTCPNRQSRLDAANNLRDTIIRKINKHSTKIDPGLPPQVFPPLGIITDTILQQYQDATFAATTRFNKTTALKKLKQNITKPHTKYGVLPLGICQALMELGIPKTKAQKLTNKFAILTQRALVDELTGVRRR